MERTNRARVTFGDVTVVPYAGTRPGPAGNKRASQANESSSYSYSDYSDDYSYYGSYTQSSRTNSNESSSYSQTIESSGTKTQPPPAREQQQQQQQQSYTQSGQLQPQLQVQPLAPQHPPRAPVAPQQPVPSKSVQGPRGNSAARVSTESYTGSYSSYSYSYSDSTDEGHNVVASARSGHVAGAAQLDSEKKRAAAGTTTNISAPKAPIGSVQMPTITQQTSQTSGHQHPPMAQPHLQMGVQQVSPWAQQVPVGNQQPPAVHSQPPANIQQPRVGSQQPVGMAHKYQAARTQQMPSKTQLGRAPATSTEGLKIDNFSGSGSDYYSYSPYGSHSGSYTGSYSSYSYTQRMPGQSYSSGGDYTTTVEAAAPARPVEPPKPETHSHTAPPAASPIVRGRVQDDDSYSYSYSYSYGSVSSPEVKHPLPPSHVVKAPQPEQDANVVSVSSSELGYTGSYYDSEYDYSYDYSESATKTQKAVEEPKGAEQHSKSTVETTTSLIKPTTSGYTGSESYSASKSGDYSIELSGEGGVTSSESTEIPSPARIRKTILLAAPSEAEPRFHSLPRGCIVPHSSMEDTLSSFLDQLAELQVETMERNRVLKVLNTEVEAAKDLKERKVSDSQRIASDEANSPADIVEAPISVIPSRNLTRKSLMFALRAVGVEKAKERYKILEDVDTVVPREKARTILEYYGSRCLTEKVMSMFVAYDEFYSGEVPLSIAFEILEYCGLVTQTVGKFKIFLRPQVSQGQILLCVADQPQEATENIVDDAEGEKRWIQPQTYETTVRCCGEGWKYGDHKVYWNGESGDVFVGSFIVAKGITERKVAVQLLRYIEAFLYVCHAIMVVTVGTGMKLRVLYTPLVEKLLNPTVKGVTDATSFLYELAFGSVFNPKKYVKLLANNSNLRDRYLCEGDDAVLHDTIRPKHLVPKAPFMINGDKDDELNTLLMSTANSYTTVSANIWTQKGVEGCYLEVGVEKLRISEKVPENARCYCLVSVRKSKDSEWMTAEVLQAVSVGKANKGGFKWKFGKSSSDRLFFTGAIEDSLYVEACYDIVDASGETTTYCVGHVLVPCGKLKSGKLPVRPGSCYTYTPLDEALKQPVEASGGFCAPRRKTAGPPAKSLTVTIKRLRSKDVPDLKTLPSRCLSLHRHVSLMSLMCAAVISGRDGGSHPLRWLRQQQVQCCFMVTADSELMDILQGLWKRVMKGKLGPKPQNLGQKYKRILILATKVVAAHNNITGGDQGIITDVVAGKKGIPFTENMNRPLRPVCV
uniref:Uncharacterized protein n=1 Tax=Trypanosoma brucei TaxID=5691 RepID=Q57YH7_9TRYP|nr:hypothetical protein, conserved [Trypanosoma brucei]